MIRKGGKLLIVDWQVGRFPLGPKPEDKIAPEKIIEIATGMNLQLEQQFPAGQFHYGMVLVK